MCSSFGARMSARIRARHSAYCGACQRLGTPLRMRIRQWLGAYRPRRLQRRLWVRSRSLRFFIKSFLNVGIVLSQSGCPRYLKDQEAHKKPFQLDLKGVQCMNQIPHVLTDYFRDSLKKEELHDTTNCIDKALDQFLMSVQGEQQGVYEDEEVRRFFQRYIFKRDISPELVHEIMKLKAALLGGSTEFITTAEFERFHKLLGVLEEELLNIYPHLNVLLLRESTHFFSFSQRDRLDKAISVLRQSITRLLGEVNIADSDYSLPEMDLLLGEIETFAGISDPNDPFTLWRRNIPTLEKFKTLLVGESVEMRTHREITEIWNMLIEVYRLGLQYHGGLHRMDWSQASNFQQLDAWVEDLFMVLSRGMALRNKSQIPFARIDDMVDEFYARGFWPHSLSPKTIKLTYRQFIQRFLDHQGADLVALEGRHILQLHREYQAFKLIQKVLIDVFEKENYRLKSDLVDGIDNVSVNQKIEEIAPLSLRDQKFLHDAWNEFKGLVSQSITRHWDARDRAYIRVAGNDTWSYAELTRLNLVRGLTSFFVRGYGSKQRTTSDEAFTATQFKELFTEFHDLGKELKFFDLRNGDSSSRTAKEADLFSPSGNGDGKVQFAELFDLISMIWSEGITGVESLKTYARIDHCETPDLDYFEKPYLEKECAKNSFKTNFQNLFSHLGPFAKYIERFPEEKWHDFYKNLLVVSQTCPNNPMGLETGDQRAMMVVMHYVENIFAVFDYNLDGQLDDGEVNRAYPRFRAFISEMTEEKVRASSPVWASLLDKSGWETLSQNVFKFVVFEGRIPTSEDLSFWNLFNQRAWTDRADRGDILKVLSVLKSTLPASPVGCYEKAN